MSAPHYVATKVGEKYVLMPTTPAAVAHTPALLVGGTALALAAVLARGPARWALAGLGGAALVAWASTNWDRHTGAAAAAEPPAHGPSFPSQSTSAEPARGSQPPADAVDEASMESFPASDPPSRQR